MTIRWFITLKNCYLFVHSNSWKSQSFLLFWTNNQRLKLNNKNCIVIDVVNEKNRMGFIGFLLVDINFFTCLIEFNAHCAQREIWSALYDSCPKQDWSIYLIWCQLYRFDHSMISELSRYSIVTGDMSICDMLLLLFVIWIIQNCQTHSMNWSKKPEKKILIISQVHRRFITQPDVVTTIFLF